MTILGSWLVTDGRVYGYMTALEEVIDQPREMK